VSSDNRWVSILLFVEDDDDDVIANCLQENNGNAYKIAEENEREQQTKIIIQCVPF